MGIEPVELGFGVLAQAQSCLEFNGGLLPIIDKRVGLRH
jgi:hypothetical protein